MLNLMQIHRVIFLVVSLCIFGSVGIVLLNFGIFREGGDLLIYVKRFLKGLIMRIKKLC